jgi:hypothetical protein
VSERIFGGGDTDLSPSELLMKALEWVEGADRVFIIVNKSNEVMFKSNCTHKDGMWLLDQAKYCLMTDLFSPGKP